MNDDGNGAKSAKDDAEEKKVEMGKAELGEFVSEQVKKGVKEGTSGLAKTDDVVGLIADAKNTFKEEYSAEVAQLPKEFVASLKEVHSKLEELDKKVSPPAAAPKVEKCKNCHNPSPDAEPEFVKRCPRCNIKFSKYDIVGGTKFCPACGGKLDDVK